MTLLQAKLAYLVGELVDATDHRDPDYDVGNEMYDAGTCTYSVYCMYAMHASLCMSCKAITI